MTIAIVGDVLYKRGEDCKYSPINAPHNLVGKSYYCRCCGMTVVGGKPHPEPTESNKDYLMRGDVRRLSMLDTAPLCMQKIILDEHFYKFRTRHTGRTSQSALRKALEDFSREGYTERVERELCKYEKCHFFGEN